MRNLLTLVLEQREGGPEGHRISATSLTDQPASMRSTRSRLARNVSFAFA